MKSKQIGPHLILIVLVLCSLLPIIFAISYSLRIEQNIYGTPFTLIPPDPSLENYKTIFSRLPILRIIGNTMFIAAVVTFFKTLTGTLAAYAFVFFDFKGKNILYFILISTIFIPFTVTMIPNYLTVSALKLGDNPWGVILPQLSDATGIFLIRQSMRTIPRSLVEISHLEDIGHMRILKDIVVPICRPAIISTTIIFFINSWNEYVWPLLVLRTKEQYTLSLALQLFVDAEGGSVITLQVTMAVITMAVPIILYLFFQRYIMSTFAASGIK